MPDTANARLALRRLVAGLVVGRDPLRTGQPIDELIASLDTDEAADLVAVFDVLLDAEQERPRFVMVAKERDYHTGAARGMLVIDLVNVDAHNVEAELMAVCPGESYARTLTTNLNSHPPVPPVPPYDVEPF